MRKLAREFTRVGRTLSHAEDQQLFQLNHVVMYVIEKRVETLIERNLESLALLNYQCDGWSGWVASRSMDYADMADHPSWRHGLVRI